MEQIQVNERIVKMSSYKGSIEQGEMFVWLLPDQLILYTAVCYTTCALNCRSQQPERKLCFSCILLQFMVLLQIRPSGQQEGRQDAGLFQQSYTLTVRTLSAKEEHSVIVGLIVGITTPGCSGFRMCLLFFVSSKFHQLLALQSSSLLSTFSVK